MKPCWLIETPRQPCPTAALMWKDASRRHVEKISRLCAVTMFAGLSCKISAALFRVRLCDQGI